MNWKGYVIDASINYVLPALASLLTLLLILRPGVLGDVSRSRFRMGLLLFTLLSRWGYAFFLFVVLGYGGGGDHGSWIRNHVEPVLQGAVPGRDFSSAYGPFLIYLQAAGVWLTGHHAGLILPFLVGDTAAVLLSLDLAARVSGEAAERWIGVLIGLSPLLWQHTVRLSSDEPMVLGFVLAAALAVVARRDILGGCLAALGLLTTKALFLVYGCALGAALLREPRRLLRFALTALAVSGAVYGVHRSLGGSLFQYGVDEHFQVPAYYFVDLPDVVRTVVPLSVPTCWVLLWTGVALTGGAGVTAALSHRGPPDARSIVRIIAVTHCTMAIAFPGIMISYVVQGLTFTALTVYETGNGRLQTAFTVVLALLGSLFAWFAAGVWHYESCLAWQVVRLLMTLAALATSFLALYAATIRPAVPPSPSGEVGR